MEYLKNMPYKAISTKAQPSIMKKWNIVYRVQYIVYSRPYRINNINYHPAACYQLAIPQKFFSFLATTQYSQFGALFCLHYFYYNYVYFPLFFLLWKACRVLDYTFHIQYRTTFLFNVFQPEM